MNEASDLWHVPVEKTTAIPFFSPFGSRCPAPGSSPGGLFRGGVVSDMRRFLRTPQNARGRFAGPWSLEWASGDKSRTSDLVNLHPQADRKWGFWVMLTGLLRGSQDFWFTDRAAASEAHSKTYHLKANSSSWGVPLHPLHPCCEERGGAQAGSAPLQE